MVALDGRHLLLLLLLSLPRNHTLRPNSTTAASFLMVSEILQFLKVRLLAVRNFENFETFVVELFPLR